MRFSFFDREAIVRELTEITFDLVIIGGGITGAGIALDAATRGMKVALVEKNDFSSGTSSKSTKLIHGGLRYLKQFHFKMVAEVGRERRIVHNLAPHLVIPEKMLLPIMKGGSMGMFSISAGLKIYDLLAGVKGDDQRIMLNKKKAILTEPLLPEDRISGAGFYAEYRTDDARLNIEVLKTAHANSTLAVNYMETTDFLYADSKVKGIICKDRISDRSVNIRGHYVVNAAGPWVDDIRKLNHSLTGKHLHITKGIHMVISREKLPVRQSMYFEVPDGRMIFIIPREDISYIGTTDTDYKGDKDKLYATREDAEYLLKAVNSTLPSIELTLNDIISSWAGIRPLISEEGKSASEISRKDEIFISGSGLISIAGGKLTGYRLMASKVVNIVSGKTKKEFGKSFRKRKSRHFPLCGSNFSNYDEVINYINKIAVKLSLMGMPDNRASYLVHNYGYQTEKILDQVLPGKGTDMEETLLMKELAFCINEEMVVCPLDFLERRTGRLLFDIHSVEKYYEKVTGYFRDIFDWPDNRYEKELAIIESKINCSKNLQT